MHVLRLCAAILRLRHVFQNSVSVTLDMTCTIDEKSGFEECIQYIVCDSQPLDPPL
jgi:hypothetical protein